MGKGNFEKIINNETPVLIDFHAEWCGPCKTMKPILLNLKDKVGDSVRIIKIDIDKNQSIAQRYDVRSVPTLMLFKNGTSVWRQSGVLQVQQINQAIAAHL